MASDNPEIPTLGYEQARDELVGIVRALESGQAPLEDTLALWERGEALAAHCRSILDSAQQRLVRVQSSETGPRED
ncbi:exodeoxyribonuclease VII small subunit [Schaalia hyovaginalis]|uniref:exodeoxyribonuclease VII small subunit n=1 Tax=Schaalia hyovaginalis TaxID=29316 RepID=UPI002A83BC10|nr:exodeoxyribonuclease VII small subunit [Schaalia hyovaginalis]MDY3666478.1 exodeoxyribonuclease VII small subunit [Schaalia hyovaginalis]